MKKRVYTTMLALGMAVSSVPMAYANEIEIETTVDIAGEKLSELEKSERINRLKEIESMRKDSKRSSESISVFTLETINTLTEGDFEYTIDGSNATITKYIGNETDVTIPATIGGKTVTSLGDIFPDTDRIVSINIPASVTSMVDDIFSYCYSLKTITVATGNTAFEVVDNVLFSKDSTKLICMPAQYEITSYTVPTTTKIINDYAFVNQYYLENLIISEGVETINDNAFAWSGLKTISIPTSVTNIADDAFYYCQLLETITVAAENAYFEVVDNVLFSKDKTVLICMPAKNNIKSYTVPNGVSTINNNAFHWNETIETVVLPDSLLHIGDCAFHFCSSLKSITLPSSLLTIGERAFSQCMDLSGDISIPATVTSIGFEAFSSCISLSNIIVNQSNTKYEATNGVLFDKIENILMCMPANNSATNYNVPSGTEKIEEGAFSNCFNITSVTIPEGVTEIGDYGFWNCSDLVNISIPASVTSIGGSAFASCSLLESITVDASNSHFIMDNGVLFNKDKTTLICVPPSRNNDTEYIIPNTVTKISDSAFSSCNNFTSVIIPDSVTYIGWCAFESCHNLTSIVIPNSVTYMDWYAFAWCTNLETVVLSEKMTSIGMHTFEYCTNLETITIPVSITNIAFSAFNECNALTTVNYGGDSASWNLMHIEDYNDALNTANIIYDSTDDYDGSSTPPTTTPPTTTTPDDGTTPEVSQIYTITLDHNIQDTTEVFTEILDTNSSGKLNYLPTISGIGYNFLGWYLADGTKVTTDTIFKADTTITAKWISNGTSDDGTSNDGTSSGGSSSSGSSSSGGSSSGSSSSGGSSNYYDNDYDDDRTSSNNSSSSSSNNNTSGDGNYSSGTGSSNTTTTAPTAPTTVVNTPIVTPATTTNVMNSETKVDDVTGNTITTISYGNGAEVVKETTPDGKTTAEITGIKEKTALSIPLETTPSPTQVVVIVKADGTREIVKDSIIDGDGFRITLDADAKIEVIDNAKDFGDIKAGSWYEDSVKFATSRELFFGMADGVFAPEGTMTRAMIWSVLYQYQGDGSSSGGSDWFSDAQAWSMKFGVSDGTNPNDNMTREQLVTILYRLGGDSSTTGNVEKFGDSTNVSDWASEAMNWAVAEGIIAGSNGNLNPQASATRAEVAAIMMRFMEK